MKQITILPEVIEQIVVDTSGKHPRYIAVSHNKKHMQISPLAYTLLEKVHAGNSFAAIAQDLSRERERTIAPEEVQKAYEYVVAKISKIGSEKERKPGGFWFKFPVIPAPSVQEIASAFTFMFHPLATFVALSSISLLTVYAVIYGLTRSIPANPIMIIPAYLLFLVSLFAHEFGHASACMKGGVEPSEIGIAVYLFFPVFYSDVSASWQLKRWQKVRVDIGGIYFQLCVGGIYLLLFIITRQAVFQWATFMLVSSCLVSLNPFMKFDGYWVLTDIMDVANLSRQPLYLLTYFYRAIFKKQQQAGLRHSKGVCIAILIYSLLSAAFWIYLIVAFLPLLHNAAIGYPTLVASTIRHFQHNNGALLMVDLQGLAINALVIILYGGGFCRICIPLLWKSFAIIKNSERRGQLVQHDGVRSGDEL
jgi:putative peptide zinc metalloprotease protein